QGLFSKAPVFTAPIIGAKPTRMRPRKKHPMLPEKNLALARNRRRPPQNNRPQPHRLNRKRNRQHDDDDTNNDEISLRGVPARKRSRAYLLPQLRRTPGPLRCGRAKKRAGPAGRASAFAENVGTAEQ